MRLRDTFAEIHLSHLRHNFTTLKKLIDPQVFFCPMVKADAYGHGDVEVAKHLEKSGAAWLGVSLVEEGVRLRTSGVSCSILCFAFFDQLGAEEMIRYQLTPVIGSFDQVEKLERAREDGIPLAVHLKFNTGMSRLGFEPNDAQKVAHYFAAHPEFRVTGVCTHLLNGEDATDSNGRTAQQYKLFEKVASNFPNVALHAMNSAALLQAPDARIQNRVLGLRPGISIYGVWPEIAKSEHVDLKPVMQLKSSLGLIRRVYAGDSVSYGGRWTAARESIIGVVPIGYADGYRRDFSNRGQMLYRGVVVPVVGTVCMDYSMVDLTDVLQPNSDVAHPGDEVVLFGDQLGPLPTSGRASLGVDDQARLIGTISYEILTQVGKRIPRVFVHEY